MNNREAIYANRMFSGFDENYSKMGEYLEASRDVTLTEVKTLIMQIKKHVTEISRTYSGQHFANVEEKLKYMQSRMFFLPSKRQHSTFYIAKLWLEEGNTELFDAAKNST